MSQRWTPLTRAMDETLLLVEWAIMPRGKDMSPVCQSCIMEFSPQGAGGERENHRGQWVNSLYANRSTSSQPKIFQMCSSTCRCICHSPAIPASTGSLLPGLWMPGCRWLSMITAWFLPRVGYTVPTLTEVLNADCPDDWCRRPLWCSQYRLAHGSHRVVGESLWGRHYI